jgi:hypothetical protein
MINVRTPLEQDNPIGVLFPPDAVPVIDIFRALGDFEDHYDIAALDLLERNLLSLMSPDAAKSVVSDALLLAFSLRRERPEPLSYAPIRSRRGTLDEYRLLALLGAASCQDPDLAADAAAALKIVHARPILALAADIARRLRAAGVELDAPDLRLLRDAAPVRAVEVTGNGLLVGDFKLRFDL